MNTAVTKVLKKVFVILIVVALITAMIAVYTSGDTKAADQSIVRVKLSVGTPSQLNFSLYGNYGIAQEPGLSLSTGSYSVKVESGVLKLYCGSNFLYAGADIVVKEFAPFEGTRNFATLKTTEHGTNSYLGNIQFKLDGSHIDVINHVYLEYYLYGVVPHEMSNSWPMEALKTQAVAARTYAVRYMGGGSYDMVDTAANQVYHGYDASYANAIQAVNETAKMVLKSGGQLVPTYYSASNGGYVDIVQHVWSSKTTKMPYHVTKKDEYDTQNAWSLQEVLIFPKSITDTGGVTYQYSSSGKMVTGSGSESANAERYLKIAALPSVAAQGYIAAVSGDVEIVGVNSFVPHTHEDQHDILDYNGQNNCVCFKNADVSMTVLAYRNATVEEEEQTGQALIQEQVTAAFTIDMHELDKKNGIYQAFNNTSLRLFVVEETDTSWNLYHRRYGHGIGMSQRSAQTRAKSGHTYQQILSFYYPNTNLEALDISPPDLGEAPPDTSEGNATIINCVSFVNVRSTPNTDYSPIGKALFGQRITVTQPNAASGWHKIDFGGLEAYIYAYYVLLDPEPTPTATPAPSATVTPAPSATATATPAPSATATPAPSATVTPAPSATVTPAPSATATATPAPSATATPAPSATVTPTPDIVRTGTVWVNYVNIRSGPSTSHSKLGNYGKGDVVSVIEVEPVSDWHKILYNGQVAYIYADFVTLDDAPSIAVTGTVWSSILNIRTGPSTSHSKLGSFGKGDKVDIVKLNYTQNWHQILYNGKIAYVHANYVSVGNVGGSGTSAVYASVNANELNFRNSASLSSTVIKTLRRGDIVQILEKGSTWHKVKYGGKEGYMYAKYLKVSSGTYGKVTGSVLNVRSGASTSTKVLDRLSYGDVVEILDKGSRWHKIRYGSSTAYVYAKYIEIL